MTRIKMHISKAKLPFYLLGKVKCGSQNEVLIDDAGKYICSHV